MKSNFRHRLRITAWLWCLSLVPWIASGQSLPLQSGTVLYNFQSGHGVPLSTTNNNPPGSDGRAPTTGQQQDKGLPIYPPTVEQFSSLISFGGLATPRQPDVVVALSTLASSLPPWLSDRTDLRRIPGLPTTGDLWRLGIPNTTQNRNRRVSEWQAVLPSITASLNNLVTKFAADPTLVSLVQNPAMEVLINQPLYLPAFASAVSDPSSALILGNPAFLQAYNHVDSNSLQLAGINDPAVISAALYNPNLLFIPPLFSGLSSQQQQEGQAIFFDGTLYPLLYNPQFLNALQTVLNAPLKRDNLHRLQGRSPLVQFFYNPALVAELNTPAFAPFFASPTFINLLPPDLLALTRALGDPNLGWGLAGFKTDLPKFLSSLTGGNAVLVAGQSLTNNAAAIGLPTGGSGPNVLTMTFARVGAPYIGQSISYLLGATIPVPTTDYTGNTNLVDLPNSPQPENYWLAEPFTTNSHASDRFYWSPNKGAVFATQPGQIMITWQRSFPFDSAPADAPNPSKYFRSPTGQYYPLLTVPYLVSGSPIQPTRTIYWTEGDFAGTGVYVQVPVGLAPGGVHIAFNDGFPQYTAHEYGKPPITTNQPQNEFQTTNTLWLDPQIHAFRAYNAEGRLFVEFLGDASPDRRSFKHLGFEIVDVKKTPIPQDVTNNLGEVITAWPDGMTPTGKLPDAQLLPSVPIALNLNKFLFRKDPSSAAERVNFYAIAETFNQNDVLIHWLESGLLGLRWPYLFDRYKLRWPLDSSAYSHYIRPLAATPTDAALSAIQLPSLDAPSIVYQDAFTGPRAFLTPDFHFYTFLDLTVPAHRTLLRYQVNNSVFFERVFSWLDLALRTNSIPGQGGGAFAGTVVTNLNGWDTNELVMNFPDSSTSPRVVSQVAAVGNRIQPPNGELGDGSPGRTNYMAGYIYQPTGDSFSVSAYINPLAADGFPAANLGSIIPVNANPLKNQLEVWWFRNNAPPPTNGFTAVSWPSVIGYYTLQWPIASPQLILASNAGSGPLPSLKAKGHIYYQNDATLPGYNPNEEHALLQGGQVFALRDDLNITVTNGPSPYSSAPFVLLEYIDTDGRPTQVAYQVRREAPELGITFNYSVKAGIVLQPPMPLPLLDKPMAPKVIGLPPQTLNVEVSSWSTITATPPASGNPFATLGVDKPALMHLYQALAFQDLTGQTYFQGWKQAYGVNLANGWFYPTSSDPQGKNVTGVPSAVVPLSIASDTNQNTANFASGLCDYLVDSTTNLLPTVTVLIADAVAASNWVATIQAVGVNGAGHPIVTIQFSDSPTGVRTNASVLVIPDTVATGQTFVGWSHSPETISTSLPSGSQRDTYSSFTLKDRKGNQWVYRGPHTVNATPYTVMQFYYKTLPGFFFPTLSLSQQPDVGTVTPYLRSPDHNGGYQGDPVQGHSVPLAQTGDGNALPIYYSPFWPSDVPVLDMAQTLTVPTRGLPAVRGQTSLEVLYQQSEYTGGTAAPSVILHDPTRAKVFLLGNQPDSTSILGKIPGSARTQLYQGKTYFPALPPHLADRFFFDPNLGKNGGLSLIGTFQDDVVGDKYLLLNVLSSSDLATLDSLVDPADPLYMIWTNTLATQLSTSMQRFVENPAQPGTFTADVAGQLNKSALQVAEVVDQDVAVDSYALTAIGPGTGYVTLVAGNGIAFTPTDDPVSVEILRVNKTLYPGEVKIVQSSNPFAEKVTMQQVVDLAGQVDQYQFDWRITPPVDGNAPPVYLRTPTTLMSAGSTFTHLEFPLPGESVGDLSSSQQLHPERFIPDVAGSVVPLPSVAFTGVSQDAFGHLVFALPPGQANLLRIGNRVQIVYSSGSVLTGSVTADTTPSNVVVALDPLQNQPADFLTPVKLAGRSVAGQPQALVYHDFNLPASTAVVDLWLSLNLDNHLGAVVYLDGQPVATVNQPSGNSSEGTPSADLSPLPHVFQLSTAALGGGIPAGGGMVTHRLAAALYSAAAPDARLIFDAKLEGHTAVDQVVASGSPWLPLDPVRYPDGVRAILGGTADVRALSDNYLIMRYRATNVNHASYVPGGGWSQWTDPRLVEGWIKRVLAGINPFNQRVTDLFNNKVNTDANILTSAGHRWEGDVALNLASVNNYGLIEIYETILRRGRNLSIDGGINYGPANDALLLAAGYISDLYKLVGDEAWADANNPTISIGSKDVTYGNIATSLFPFMGQVATLMEQQQDMLRGRDDFSAPGVQIAPVYNRLYWNYTRGINSGEVIYALNYDIQPNPDVPLTGSITAADAAHLFPMGHGDAYGHYLTALTGYYSLLMNPNFSWIPQAEAVNVLGVPVLVGYMHERKFAAAASALGQAGLLALKLTTKSDYVSGHDEGWDSLTATRSNPQTGRTRYFSADHWASRVAQGTFLNWVVGNSLLPPVDPDPSHEGVQKIDRTTVPELRQLPITGSEVQTVLDNAEGGLNPLGLPENAIAFDINPNQIIGSAPVTHFEQVYARALGAMANAGASFDDATSVTRQMRSQKDSVADYQTLVDSQERSYTNSLIELYGTPYTDDIGPGQTYVQGYVGPDLLHYMYVDNTDLVNPNLDSANYIPGMPQEARTYKIDIQVLPSNWWNSTLATDSASINATRFDGSTYTQGTHYISYNLGPRGFAGKPSSWQGRRQSPGQMQSAISTVNAAYDALRAALTDAETAKRDADKAMDLFNAKVSAHDTVRSAQLGQYSTDRITDTAKFALDVTQKVLSSTKSVSQQQADVIQKALPKSLIFGVAFGGDQTSIAAAAIQEAFDIESAVIDFTSVGLDTANKSLALANSYINKSVDLFTIQPTQWNLDLQQSVAALGDKFKSVSASLISINAKTRAYDDAVRAYRALVAKGDRLQAERQTFRQRAAAVIQGYRTRDAALRLFRNEKLERYNSLFDLASTYSLLAAKAYDYETGLLNTDQGRSFLRRIVSSRALGVFTGGTPQFGGSDNGDPGLSSALAEMKADWDVLKGRLGYGNPDTYGTLTSLRTELHRILPGTEGSNNWKTLLSNSRMDNVLDDPDVRRYCLQIDPGGGLPVPGLVLPFSTVIAKGYNLFGSPLAGGDHSFPSTAFATKLFATGISFEGYVGIDNPTSNSGVTAGSTSQSDPSATYLNSNALAADPEVYLIPVGVDSMRSPPLGDTSDVRSWTVSDIAIPVPFNIGGSDFSTKPLWGSSQSLSEPLYAERKHPAFRAVGASSVFWSSVLSGAGNLQRSQYTSSRLIGRSVWNSQWKIVIPGNTLLNNPNEGLDRFIRTVSDIRILFQTYSYSGN